MLRQRRPSLLRDKGRFEIDRFIAAAATAIVLCCLCAPPMLALHTGTKADARNVVLTDSDPIPNISLTEVGIQPQAVQMYRQAVRELHSGEARLAEKDALRAVALDAKFADADALAATAALAQREFSRARAEACDAVRIDANDEKAWVILATADNYLGRYADAVDALGHVRQQDQSTWQVGYQWARAEAGQDHTAQTLDWANRSALTAPAAFAPLHLLRASALAAVNEYSQSADELGTYLQLLGENAPERDELTRELHRLRALSQNGAISQPPAGGEAGYNALAN